MEIICKVKNKLNNSIGFVNAFNFFILKNEILDFQYESNGDTEPIHKDNIEPIEFICN